MAEKQRKLILAGVGLLCGLLTWAGVVYLSMSLNSAQTENEELSAQVSTLTSRVATLEQENADLEDALAESMQRGDACLNQAQAYGEAAYNYGSLLVWLLGDNPVGPTPDMSLGTSAMGRGNDVIGCY